MALELSGHVRRDGNRIHLFENIEKLTCVGKGS